MPKNNQPKERVGIPVREMDAYFTPEADFDNPKIQVTKLNPAADRENLIAECGSRKNKKYFADYAKKHKVEINNLFSAIEEQTQILAAAVSGHKDYHDNYENPNDEEWLKIQQYDAINRLHPMNFPEIIITPSGKIDFDLDDADLEMAREWNNGYLKPIIDVLEKHINALSLGKMTVLYDTKTQQHTYYEHENHLADVLQARDAREK